MGKNFTSESVTCGHPDKICDQIADAILDNILSKDNDARVACEVSIARGLVHIFGEITTSCYVDIDTIARGVINNIGYNNTSCGFDGNTCGIILSIGIQSNDIALGVDNSYESKQKKDQTYDFGAGDQGMMFGFATDQTPQFMPMPIIFAHKLSKRLEVLRKNFILDYLGPDGKTQVTVEYENDIPVKILNVVVSTQHSESVTNEKIKKDILEHVIYHELPPKMLDNNTSFFINPTGRFVIGGPVSDSGLTGRKIIVDTYGGFARHGGGAFSGKDPTKVDRSGAYMARYVAKNLVASGVAKNCEVRVAYAIGVSNPIDIFVETFGSSKFSDELISEKIKNIFDFKPSSIIKNFKLKSIKYLPFATYGHMGRDEFECPWEALDKISIIKDLFNI